MTMYTNDEGSARRTTSIGHRHRHRHQPRACNRMQPDETFSKLHLPFHPPAHCDPRAPVPGPPPDPPGTSFLCDSCSARSPTPTWIITFARCAPLAPRTASPIVCIRVHLWFLSSSPPLSRITKRTQSPLRASVSPWFIPHPCPSAVPRP